MLTEAEYQDQCARRDTVQPHPLCALLRQLRHARRMTMAEVERRFGVRAILLGSYERGERVPTAPKLDAILRCYGYKLEVTPLASGPPDVSLSEALATELHTIAAQLEENHALSALSSASA